MFKSSKKNTNKCLGLPTCSACQDTGSLPNRIHIGGYPHLCICQAGVKKRKWEDHVREFASLKPECLSCGDTGYLSIPGVKTVPCNCRLGDFYRTVEMVGGIDL